jgi:hypothetical protein
MQPLDGFVDALGQAKIVPIDNDPAPDAVVIHDTNIKGFKACEQMAVGPSSKVWEKLTPSIGYWDTPLMLAGGRYLIRRG